MRDPKPTLENVREEFEQYMRSIGRQAQSSDENRLVAYLHERHTSEKQIYIELIKRDLSWGSTRAALAIESCVNLGWVRRHGRILFPTALGLRNIKEEK